MYMQKPKHIGFIMDGNGRWATQRGLSRSEGHRRGYEKVKEVLRWCKKRDIRILTVYAFSHENWGRPQDEVNFLMELILYAFQQDKDELLKEGMQIRILGNKGRFSREIQSAIATIEEESRNNDQGILNIALNYGGREEILQACRRIMLTEISEEEVTEGFFEQHLYTAGLPDPDLVIRTSGIQRLSGFLLWQAAYAELYFEPVNWPEFTEEKLEKILTWFREQKRNFGK